MNERYPMEFRTVDELLGNESSTEVAYLSVEDIDEFPKHPFKVCEDENFNSLVESISQIGITNPVLVRQMDDRYQLISGHRRKRAAEKLGIDVIPAIIKEMSDDDAVIAMVDSNKQRNTILPSEKAKAYKLKHEAIKHQGKVGGDSLEELAGYYSEGAKTVQRFIRVASLIPELLDLLDAKRIGFMVAVKLTVLSSEEQAMVAKMIGRNKLKLSGRSVTTILALHDGKCLTEAALRTLVNESETKAKKGEPRRNYADYFPKGTPKEEIERTIISLLEKYCNQYQK